MKNQKLIGVTASMLAALLVPGASWALEGGHEFEIVGRTMYWNDTGLKTQTTTTPVSYQQSAVGLQLNYKSPYWANIVGFDTSILTVVKFDGNGTPSTSILEVENSGQVADHFSTLSQATIKFNLADIGQIRVGRQTQSGLLLSSSSTRAAPDTFAGVTATLTPLQGLQLYGAVYDQWRARSSSNFEKFKTESTGVGVVNEIDYIAIGGARYMNGSYEVRAEYLNAKDYLAKYGVVVSYKLPVDKNILKFTGGVFGSQDAGSLFVCGAEKEMDCTGTGRMSHSATGVYLDADWKAGDFSLGGAVSTFNGLWIEDNFAANAMKTGTLSQDHGTNPFPTSSIMGPDFANNGETAWTVRAGYDFNSMIPGLNANFKYVKGTGAKASNVINAAIGSENYKELNVRYALPFAKNLLLSYSYGDYSSYIENFSATDTIKGLTRASWQLHRMYLDYSLKF